MNGIDGLERQIAERLHGHSRMAPDNDGWEAILDRIEHRGRARHRRRAATTGLVAAGMVGALVVVLPGDDATRVSTTPAGPTATSPSATDGVAVGAGLPRLVLDVAGFELTRAANTDDGSPYPDLGPLLVYGAPGDGILGPGPVLFVRVVPAGASYGIGDGPDVREVDIGGRPGRIFSISAGLSLGWSREDGSLVHLLAIGLAEDDVVVAGQTLAEALGHEPPTTLPGGFELRRSTPADLSPSSQAEVDYRFEGGSASLRLLSGGTYRLDDLLVDRLVSSVDWRSTTVDGRPAVLSTYQGSTGVGGPGRTVMWALTDGVVAELTAHGLTETELEAAAATIHPVDEGEWQSLLARSDALQPALTPDQLRVEAVHGVVSGEICQARDRWLQARAAGDIRGATAAMADLGLVLEKGEVGGLGETGDILVVAQRLLDAMAAGDDAVVSSIPEGGACS